MCKDFLHCVQSDPDYFRPKNRKLFFKWRFALPEVVSPYLLHYITLVISLECSNSAYVECIHYSTMLKNSHNGTKNVHYFLLIPW